MPIASTYRRVLGLTLLGCLSLWNAPAMAFPALIADLSHCEALSTAAPRAIPTIPAAHHDHHAGMQMDMSMPMPAAQTVSMADCLSQHSCCTFNREPAKKSNPYAVAQDEARQETAAPAMSQAPRHAHNFLPDYRRAVFDLKTDLRI